LHHAIFIQIEGASYRLHAHCDLVPEHTRAISAITAKKMQPALAIAEHLQLGVQAIPGCQPGEERQEHAETAPAHEPVVDRLGRAIFGRCIAPAQAAADHEDDPQKSPAGHPPAVSRAITKNRAQSGASAPSTTRETQPRQHLPMPPSESEPDRFGNRLSWILS
jgi:hypothetical protein